MSEAPPEPLPAATFCATVVDEWVALGVIDAVVCPGSRSTPMALALAEHDGVRVHVHLDERSGSFLALGLAKATGRAVPVLTTSGTATVELHPAVAEASYAGVPLVACTADRPPELHGRGAPQAMDQADLYGTAVRTFLDPGPPEDLDPARWRAIASEAVAAAQGWGSGPPGPVQLNLAFREPLLGPVGELPPAEATGRPAAPTPAGLPEHDLALLAELVAGTEGVVVAGEGAAGSDPSAVGRLAAALGWPVLADPLSGCRGVAPAVIAHGDGLLRAAAFAEAHRPQAVLRFGRMPASKVLAAWLAGSAAPVVRVDPAGLPSDPDGLLERDLVADPALVCEALLGQEPAPAPAAWGDAWTAADAAARAAVAEVLAAHPEPTEPGVARAVASGAPDGSAVVASSSMPVRDLEWYAAPREGVRFLANRGVNGIDGVVSTAVGVALAEPALPTVALLGDLAFLHDSNGLLGAAERRLDLTLVVVDNDGGGIFSFLPQASALPTGRYEQLFGTPHGLDLAAVARAHGVARVHEPTSTAEVQAAVAATAGAPGLDVVVVRTDRGVNVAVHEEVHAAVAASLEGRAAR